MRVGVLEYRFVLHLNACNNDAQPSLGQVFSLLFPPFSEGVGGAWWDDQPRGCRVLPPGSQQRAGRRNDDWWVCCCREHHINSTAVYQTVTNTSSMTQVRFFPGGLNSPPRSKEENVSHSNMYFRMLCPRSWLPHIYKASWFLSFFPSCIQRCSQDSEKAPGRKEAGFCKMERVFGEFIAKLWLFFLVPNICMNDIKMSSL